MPLLREGAGATLNRGDMHYIVTEYGMAHIHGKNIRQRAMDLVAIAHPAFRAGLVEEARRLNLVYHDQAYLPGERGGKIRDELLAREIFYSLKEAQILIEMWRRYYNTIRPHSALGYRPPTPAAIVVQPDRFRAVGLTL